MAWLAVPEPLLQHAQLHGERDQPLLRAVVEVALQAPALGHAGLAGSGRATR